MNMGVHKMITERLKKLIERYRGLEKVSGGIIYPEMRQLSYDIFKETITNSRLEEDELEILNDIAIDMHVIVKLFNNIIEFGKLTSKPTKPQKIKPNN